MITFIRVILQAITTDIQIRTGIDLTGRVGGRVVGREREGGREGSKENGER